MHECYQSYDRGCDLENNDMIAIEGLQFYSVMMHIKNYDTAKEYILPALEALPSDEQKVSTSSSIHLRCRE